jgi:serine/threonine protein phosphatase 1
MIEGAGALRDREGPAAVLDRAKFTRLGLARRVWAVGAVHGEADRLKAVHRALGERMAPGDRLVYLGNYLGRGPDIVAVVDELLAFRRAVLSRRNAFVCDVAYLRGAQEEMWHKLLQLQLAMEPAQVLAWMIQRGVDASVRAYGFDPEGGMGAARSSVLSLTRWTGGLREAMRTHPGHDEFLHSLKRAAFTGEGGLLFVHSGLDPSRPLAAQGDALWWGSGGFSAIAGAYAGFRRVVRGFDPRQGGVAETAYTLTVDGGCGFGGALVAACLDDAGALIDRIEA